MKLTNYLTFIFISLTISTFLTSCSNNAIIDKGLMKASSEINKNCPFMVDQETRLDNTTALAGNKFQVNYTMVNVDKDTFNIDSFHDDIELSVVNHAKTSPDFKPFRDDRVTIIYKYKDYQGNFLTEIEVKPEDYLE